MAVPSDYSNLEVWYKGDANVYSDAGTTLCADGDTVRQWNDQSGNTRHATQATSGNRPACKTNIVNGKAVVRFTAASSRYMTLPYTGEPGTIIVVGKIASYASDQHWAGGDTSAAIAVGSWYFKPENPTSNDIAFMRSTSADTTASNDFHAAKTDILAQATDGFMTWIGTQDGSTINLYCGAELVGTDTTSNSLRDINSAVIGAAYYSNSVLSFLNGDIAEFIIYSRVLNSTELAGIRAYLAGRYYPNTVAASTTNRFLAGFDGTRDNPSGHVLYGTDGQTFSARAGHTFYPRYGSCRDTDLFLWNGVVYGAYTSGYPSGAFLDNNEWGIMKFTDGSHPTTHARISMVDTLSGTTRRTWSPCLVRNADNTPYVSGGNIYFVLTLNTDGWTAASLAYLVPISTSDLSTRGTPTVITGTGLPTFQIAGSIIRRLDGDFLFCTKQEQNGGTLASLKFFKSSTFGSSYTPYYDASAAGGNWGQIEGGLMCRLPNRSLRVYYDRFVAATGLAFRDSTDDGLTWSGETAVTGDGTFTVRNGGAMAYLQFQGRVFGSSVIRGAA